MNSPSISLVMLTLNEEEFLRDSLAAALPHVDDAIVIDQRSTDSTAAIAREMGARVLRAEGNFSTFGEKYFRNMAAQVCSCDWMMIIDADEVMSDGWQDAIRSFLNTRGDEYGAIELPFYHLMGSYEYHAANSPLGRVAFVRRHPNLSACPPKEGSFAHSNYYLSYDPPQIYRMPADAAAIFHLGYVQRDLMKRWRTNILRGDYGGTDEEKQAMLDEAAKNPCSAFPECVPMTMPIEAYPACLRERVGKTYGIRYNPDSKRIMDRWPLAVSETTETDCKSS